MTMRVILIPCSGRKIGGGSTLPASYVQPALGNESWTALCRARSALGDQLGLEPGPDLGNATGSQLQLLPAWQRYDGNLYRKAHLTEGDVSSR
jgi:hypothetical protein